MFQTTDRRGRVLAHRVASDAVSLFGGRAARAELERLARDAVDEI
jgi:hypothetical protein